jgi:hypothetical protein
VSRLRTTSCSAGRDGGLKVITGSHNVGFKASSMNDDNIVILEGPPRRRSRTQ